MNTVVRLAGRRIIEGVVAFSCATGAAYAQGVTITSGSLQMQSASGPMLVGGQRGFTYDGALAAADGVFGPASCNASPNVCVPGATLDLTALWVGADVRGTVTLDGNVFTGLGSTQSLNQLALHFTGSAVLPSFGGAAASVSAPFVFSGTFDHADAAGLPVREVLSGSGTATVSLVPSVVVHGGWALTAVTYVFGSALSEGWAAADIGRTGVAGVATNANGQFTVAGGGADIWGTEDGFQFAFRAAAAQQDIVTQVRAETADSGFGKAGVMMRSGLGANAAHVVLDIKPNGELEFMTRPIDGGATSYLGGSTPGFPVWLRLHNAGGVITAAYSGDAANWTVIGVTTLGLVRYAGLAVTSHDMASLNTATFTGINGAPATSASPWSDGDVGVTGAPGSALVNGNAITLTGAGSDIWGTADAFHFESQVVPGDATLVSRITRLDATNPYAKAGLMFRNSAAANAAHVILDVRPTGEIEFMTRTADGAATSYRAGMPASIAVWLKLVRRGDQFSAYSSTDGTTWIPIGTIAVDLSDTSLAGLVTTSHVFGQLTRADFDNVSVGP